LRDARVTRVNIGAKKSNNLRRVIGGALFACCYTGAISQNANVHACVGRWLEMKRRTDTTVKPPTSAYGSFAAAAVDARIVQVIAKLTF
jgi:hypothetical protein